MAIKADKPSNPAAVRLTKHHGDGALMSGTVWSLPPEMTMDFAANPG